MYLSTYVNSSGQPDESNVLNKKAKAVVGNPLGCKLSKGSGHIGILFINLNKLQTNAESVKLFPMYKCTGKGLQ